MSFERFKFQEQIENLLGFNFYSDSSNDWKSKKNELSNFSVSLNNQNVLEVALKTDALNIFYKGVYSICDGLFNLSHGYYSWSIVKFYYAIFYLLRCRLACRNVGFIKNYGIYTLKLKNNETPIKIDTNSDRRGDHKATIYAFTSIVNESDDFFQTNNIIENDTFYVPYEWYMRQREQIQYQEATFLEPQNNRFPHEIFTDPTQLKSLLERYLSNSNSIESFLPNNALLALPINLLSLTMEELFSYQNKRLSDEQINVLNNMLKPNRMNSISIFQKLFT